MNRSKNNIDWNQQGDRYGPDPTRKKTARKASSEKWARSSKSPKRKIMGL